MRSLLIPLLMAFPAMALLHAAPEFLPGTKPLEPATGDERSNTMVAGIDRFSMTLIAEAAKARHARWKENLTDESKREGFLNTMREKLRVCIGLVDEPAQGDLRVDESYRRLLNGGGSDDIISVHWRVFDGVDGQGLLLSSLPQGVKPRAIVICLPDAAMEPDAPVDFSLDPRVEATLRHAEEFVANGCEVVIPFILNREHHASRSDRFEIKTNVPHREWIHRQSFTLGRTMTGYDVAMVLSLVDSLWETHRMQSMSLEKEPRIPLGITGHGEGGWLALMASALDERISTTWVSGCFGPRERIWQEPLDRNAFGFINDFGSSELAAMSLPRPLFVSTRAGHSDWELPQPGPDTRIIAAPFQLNTATSADIVAEAVRTLDLCPQAKTAMHLLNEQTPDQDSGSATSQFLRALGITPISKAKLKETPSTLPIIINDYDFQAEHVRQLQDFTQKLIPVCEQERDEKFWKKLPLTVSPPSLEAYETHLVTEREHLWKDVIGQLPNPSLPMNPRSRFISEDPLFTVHEVMLDVWPDVVAWGYLLLPKDLKPGEKRPVVICQHGLDGLPEDVITEDEKTRGWRFYKAFAANLAREGFITFAPHNFYRGKDAFRVIQRKLNLTGKTLFSVMIGQHQRLLEWLKTQPNVDEKRIAFYGLSYGGKSAMRIPAVLPDYCLSICSGDFNEWVRKCVSVDLPMNYVFKDEYEIWEPNLARTYNYAEMAALIAPRPFMVERGHNDGVGIDEWVSYEYAKVRRLYDKLGIGERTEIEYFDGPHTVNGKGTFKFLHQWLGWPGK